MRRIHCFVLAAVLAVTAVPAGAKMKVVPPKKRPAVPAAPLVPALTPTTNPAGKTAPKPTKVVPIPVRGKAASRRGPALVGSVVFIRGGQIVAEIRGGVTDGETFNVLGADFRKKGTARVMKTLANETYLLKGTALRVGDHLSRETEVEAVARVLAVDRLDDYRSFLARFPKSVYRPRVGREMFRAQMKSRYPAYPGSVVRGKLTLAEPVSRTVGLGDARIVLDRYVIAVTSEGGEFRIEGLPKLLEPTRVRMRVDDPRFRTARDVQVDLVAGTLGEQKLNVPVVMTPTVLRGRVVDGEGAPVAGAEVWTTPYSMEVLTDEDGGFAISRRKLPEGSTTGAADEPLFGDVYKVFAHRSGFEVGVSELTAKSHEENTVEPIHLAAWDVRREALPPLAVDLPSHLLVRPGGLGAPRGGGPLLNP